MNFQEFVNTWTKVKWTSKAAHRAARQAARYEWRARKACGSGKGRLRDIAREYAATAARLDTKAKGAITRPHTASEIKRHGAFRIAHIQRQEVTHHVTLAF